MKSAAEFKQAKKQSTEYACNARPSWLTQRFERGEQAANTPLLQTKIQGISMRAIIVAAFAGALAAGAAYAHSNLSSENSSRTAGTLTCTTKPELSLVFGETPVADCTFVSERGGFKQSYAALLHRGTQRRFSEVAQTMTWRVTNVDGFARPGMLDGTFVSGTERQNDRTASFALTDQQVSLTLLSHSARAVAGFAVDHPRIALVAKSSSFTR